MIDRIYEKNEILFAVIEIVFYIASNVFLNYIYGGSSPHYLLAFNFFLLALFYRWIKRSGVSEYYGFCKFKGSYKDFLFFIPLIILVTHGLWGGINLDISLPVIFKGLYAAVGGFLEEILFRGFLFKGLLKKTKVKPAFIISVIVFSSMHAVGLIYDSSISYTLLEIIFTAAFGFMVTAIFYKGKSLVPCILLHTINNFVTIVLGAHTTMNSAIITTIIYIIISVGYAVYLLSKKDYKQFAEE